MQINQKDNELLQELKSQINESNIAFKKSKETAKKVTSYIKGDQLPPEVIELLNFREQPLMWENIFKKIDAKISGLKITSKQEIQAIGRQRGVDKTRANLITNILKTIQDSTLWWANKKRADLELRTSGLSIIETIVKNTHTKDILGKRLRELRHYHIPFLQSYIDPYAINPDYSDMRYFHKERLLIKEELYKFFAKDKVDKLKEYQKELENSYSTYKTNNTQYSKRVKVYYSWYKKWDFKTKQDVIYYCIWGGDDVILQNKKSPYKLKRFPISIRRVDEIDYTNPSDVRGIYYNLLPIQDRINNCHLRAIHMLGSNKLLFESDAVDDAEDFIESYSEDNPAIEVRSGAITQNKIKDIKQYTEISSLKAEIVDLRRQAEEIIGLNNEVLGSAVNRLSGVAIENRQNSGLVGLQDFIDTSSEVDRDLAQMDLELIQQYFTAEHIYNIVDKNEADSYFIANEIQKDSNGSILRDENKEVIRKNKLDFGRYDIILIQTPFNRGSSTERQKVWAEYIKALQVTHPQLVPAMIQMSLKDTDSPIANEVAHLIQEDKKLQAQNIQQQQETQMQQIQLNIKSLEAKIEELTSKAKLNNAKALELEKEKGELREV